MDVERAREFLRENHRAVMGSYRPDGRVQLSPVTVGLDDEGLAIISTRETAVKVKHLDQDPRAVLCVVTDKFFGKWIYVEGEAEILRLPGAMEPLVEYYRGISGEHPDWDDYRAVMERDRRVLVRVRLDHAGPDFHG